MVQNLIDGIIWCFYSTDESNFCIGKLIEFRNKPNFQQCTESTIHKTLPTILQISASSGFPEYKQT